jgi:FimV-like protein
MAAAVVVTLARWCRVAGAVLLCLALSQAAVAEDHYGPIRQGESLWQIAGGLYAGAELTREQVMLALLAENPEAFSPSCNLNGLLRAAVMLSLPSAARVRELSPESAMAEVDRQHQEWRQHRRTSEAIDCSTMAAARESRSDEETGVDRDEETAGLGSAAESALARSVDAADRAVLPRLRGQHR